MKFDTSQVNLLVDTKIVPGSRWIYSADFNVDTDLTSTGRVDSEIPDLGYIVNQGGVALVLAHKGRFGKGNVPLDFLVPHIQSQLPDSNVVYFPENSTDAAVEFSKGLAPGTVAIMGNTRFNDGDESNDPLLARKFAELGDFVAIGGFGKAHREHASNVGVLAHLPGYLAQSQIKEMELLKPWSGKSNKYSVAVLGGVKKDKISLGFKGLAQNYDAIIPGGIVLNTLLAINGYNIGNSIVDDGKTSCVELMREVCKGLDHTTAKLCIPNMVIIAEALGLKDSRSVSIERGVYPPNQIVDYHFPHSMHYVLQKAVESGGRILLAGTPSIHSKGFSNATNSVMEYMQRPQVQGIVLGGDTAREVNYKGPVSAGGGSALYFVWKETTPVFEALRMNKNRFG